MDVKKEVKRLGYRVVYVPHKMVRDHIAAYNIVYKGKHMVEPKYDKSVRVPSNQVWISRDYKKYARIILFHELQEWKHRKAGYGRKTAHRMAMKDEKAFDYPMVPIIFCFYRIMQKALPPDLSSL